MNVLRYVGPTSKFGEVGNTFDISLYFGLKRLIALC